MLRLKRNKEEEDDEEDKKSIDDEQLNRLSMVIALDDMN
jgi:hypothetical protein